MKKVTKYQLPVISLLLFAMSFTTQAQSSDTLKMSLQDCVDYAIKNNTNVKNANLDQEIANARIGEIRSTGLPQITGNVSAQHNIKLRDSYFTADINSPITGSFVQANPALQGKLIKYNNIFQLPNVLDASVTVSQLIFSGSYIVGLQAAKTYRELSQKNAKQTRIQTISNVTKAYYMALVSLERISLFNSNIIRVDSSLNQAKKSNQLGLIENIDVERLEVTLNNLITDRERFVNIMIVSNVLLKFQLGMPVENNIELTDNLEKLSFDESSIGTEKVDYTNRIEYQQLITSKRLQELDVKNNHWAYLPTMQASVNLGTFTQNKDLNFFSKSNFIDPNQSVFANYGLLQVGLNVPIFDGFGKMYRTQQSKISLVKIENNMKNFENTINLQVKQSEINFRNSLKSLENQKRNMKLAQNVSIVTVKKYKQGVGSNLEVITAESSLKESQVNYYNALYDAITYKVDYDLAVGNIK